MIRVAIANSQRFVRLKLLPLRAAVRRVLQGEGISDAEISIACVDDSAIARLNEQFLKHAGPTDVITFPLSAPGALLVGEIVLSAETAQCVAQELRQDPAQEVLRYVIHGLLHLCGYDDRTPPQCRKMRQRERHYLGPTASCTSKRT